MPRILATSVAVAALVVGVIAPGASASASATTIVQSRDVKTTLVGFNAGNMMSDAVFTAKDTMTEAQIQAFFDSKVSKCLGGSDKYGPIVCLKDFKISSVNRPADAYCDGYTGAANESAARIIYRVAQSCGINPQVLIVMLQKEQGLVNHTWPSANRYWAALGQGCPDAGVQCDPAYVGFFHQIYGAARQMQIYMEGRYFTYYAPGKTWNIYWQAPSQVNGVWSYPCGSGPVYVANKATAALYYYTPYQPNAASLRAGYGTGDACSAYGNRNFYNYFTDWFGSTQVPSYSTPTLTSVNTSSYIATVDSAGTLWGYPFEKGVWGAAQRLGTGIGSTPSVMIPGDLSGNGSRDVLVRRGAQAMVLPGSSNGFGNGQFLNVDWSGVVLSSAAGDLDGDGVPDVLTTNTAGDLLLWRGDDRGGLLPGVRVGTGWGSMNLIVGSVDLNRDGKQDLVARDAQGRLWAFYGDGRGGWLSQAQLGQGWAGMSAIFSPGDFTGDGTSDLMGRTTDGNLWLYPGNGAGSITMAGQVGTGWNGMVAMTGSGAAVTASRALTAGVGDVDNDRASDVLGITPQGTLSLYRGNGAGGWRGTAQIGTGWSTEDRVIAMGDFNGDGYKDLGRITPAGLFYLYPGMAGGGYGTPTVIGNGWQGIGLVTGGADMDGDRRVDVIGRDGAGQLVLYRGDGKGGWLGGASVVGTGWGGVSLATHVGDFDGDGNSDLIVRTADANLWLYPMNGSGSWGAPRQIGNGWGGFTAIFAPGDFDGDGAPDLMARSANGDLYLYRGNGRGGWGSAGVIGVGWNSLSSLN